MRVDDRLVHGQVTQGWGSRLHPDRLVIANDRVAADEWERSLYEASAPEGMEVSVVRIDEAAERTDGWLADKEDLLLLIEDPLDALRLHESGISFDNLNLGGLHSREGRRKVLSYVWVDEEDVAALRRLRERGVDVSCADVPGCDRKDFFECLGSAGSGT